MNTSQDYSELSILGFYEPGFIQLRINTDEDLLSINNLKDHGFSPSWLPTFFHEYIHFLQDISTTHGLLNFCLQIEELRNVTKSIRDSTESNFGIPFQFTNDHNFIANRELLSIYYGEARYQSPAYKAQSVEYLNFKHIIVDLVLSNQEKISIKKYSIRYFDLGAETKINCHFGSRHLKEYVAHALQKQFAPQTHHDDNPYLLAELILRKEAPQLATDESLMIAFCDASLMHLHPAELFFMNIERLQRDEGILFSDPESIYEFVFDSCSVRDLNGKSQTVAAVFYNMCDQALSRFDDSLKGTVYESNRVWFSKLIGNAQKLRNFRQGFITELVTSPQLLSPIFFEVLDILGTPYMTNSRNAGCFIPPKELGELVINPEFPKVFQAIRSTFRGKVKCGMYESCNTNSNGKIITKDCRSAPWNRVTKTQLCPYAQLWKTWGLSGKSPTPSTSSH